MKSTPNNDLTPQAENHAPNPETAPCVATTDCAPATQNGANQTAPTTAGAPQNCTTQTALATAGAPQTNTPTSTAHYLRSLLELFCVFFKIGIVTFGGGLAMLPILERELIEKRGWTTKERMLDYFTIGQSTPGIIAVNVATFLGYTRAKALGGIVATVGVVCPSLLIISFLALFLSNFNSIEWVQKALLGINVAVAALLTKVVYKFKNVVFRSVFTFLLSAASFVAVVVFNINTAYLIILALALSVARYFFSAARKTDGAHGGKK